MVLSLWLPVGKAECTQWRAEQEVGSIAREDWLDIAGSY